MTQHIEPVCWTSEEQIQTAQADPGHNMLIWGEPLAHHPDVALVRLSDAQAALTAAEERGRIEERERIRLDLIVGLRNWMHDRYGKWITFRSSMRFADSITKEPTP